MADLSVHAVQWCARHGRPVLVLRTGADRGFLVAITAEDAAALSSLPDASDAGPASRRLHHLLAEMIAALGARLTEVRLSIGPDHLLRASLQISGPAGAAALPAHFADGVALAQRGRLPLRMAEADLLRVPLTPLAGLAAFSPATAPASPAIPDEPAPENPPAAFRAVIESLDLTGFGQDHGDDRRGDARDVA